VQGGEDEALRRLSEYMRRGEWVRNFEKPKGNPAAFDPEPATTVLSPYLKFGDLSVRLFYKELREVYAKGQHTTPPTSLLGQLYWREFFYTVGYDTPNHEKVRPF
jgi:cryptochrome